MYIRFNSQGVSYKVRKDSVIRINSVQDNFPEIHFIDGKSISFQGSFEDLEKLLDK
jgi:hypothetical protein